MRKCQVGCFLSLAILLSFGGTVRAQQPITVISGGTLIDGRGGAPLRDAAIVIAGNRIQVLGPKSAVKYPAGAKLIDASGKFVVPGLIDTHVHYRHWAAELMLHYGITSVIDVGNETEWIFAMKEGTAKGKVFGPRIFVSGPLIDAAPRTNRSAKLSNVWVESPEEATKVARALIARDVDAFKVLSKEWMRAELIEAIAAEARKAGIPVFADLDHWIMTAREAASAGVNVIVHSQGLAISTIKDPAKLAAFKTAALFYLSPWDAPGYRFSRSSPAGAGRRAMSSVLNYIKEEPWYLTDPADYDDLIRFLLERKVAIQPTMVANWQGIPDKVAAHSQETTKVFSNPALKYVTRNARAWLTQRLDDGGRIEDLTSEELAQVRQGYVKYKQFHKKFSDAGGVILPGSDMMGSGVAALGLHHEMDLLVEVGLSPMRVIVAATKDAAEVLGKGDRLGTIEAGKLADLLVVKDDPLVDIANLRNSLELVMQDGKFVDRTFHADFTSPFPARDQEVARALISIFPEVVTEGSESLPLIVRSGTPLANTSGVQFIARDGGEPIFQPSAVVQLNGRDLATEFVSRRELRAQVPAGLIAKPGVYAITVREPRPNFPDTFPVNLIVKFK